jgi:hypothetical protein
MSMSKKMTEQMWVVRLELAKLVKLIQEENNHIDRFVFLVDGSWECELFDTESQAATVKQTLEVLVDHGDDERRSSHGK